MVRAGKVYVHPGYAVDGGAEREHVLYFRVSLCVQKERKTKWEGGAEGRRTVKKNATLPLAVALATGSFAPRIWKESSIAIISMLKPQPKDPHIIGLRRPVLSSVKVGYKEPKKNIMLMTPPSRRERLRSRPTLSWRTEVM
jgi:hypothetical protein